MRSVFTFKFLLPGVVLVGSLSGAAPEPDYYRDVYPFLKANCISCHNKTTTKAGLNMETPESMKQGGDAGPALIAGKSAESLIVQASLHQNDMEMPPANNKSGAVDLTPSEIEMLKTWVDQGAKSSVQAARQVTWQPLAAGVHPIYSVAMTRDGRFAACARSNKIYLYDLATRQLATEIVDTEQKSGFAHRALVQALAFNTDGTRLASGSFREVKIWKKQGGEPVVRKSDPAIGSVVSTVARDGKSVLSANAAGDLLVLDARTGKVLQKVDGVGPSGVKLLSASPDGTLVAVYGGDGTLQGWHLQSSKLAFAVPAAIKGVRALAWSNDGKSLATAGDDKVVRVWTCPPPGMPDLLLAKELSGATAPINVLVPGAMPGQFYAASEDGKVREWSVVEGKVTRELACGTLQSLALSADGRQMVAGSTSGVVSLWDLRTGKSLLELKGSVSLARQVAGLEWTVAAQQLDQAFQKAIVARIEAQNKALDELLKKANEAIIVMQKVLPEKQKALAPALQAKIAAEKAVEEVRALIAQAPDGKPDAPLEKKLKDAQEKVQSTNTAEASALAAISATESNVRDAEEEVKRITESKTLNVKDAATASAALETSKVIQSKATTDLATTKQAAAKAVSKPLAVAISADSNYVSVLGSDGALRVWASASGAPVEEISVEAATSGVVTPGLQGEFIACTSNSSVLVAGGPSKWVLEHRVGGEKDPALFVDRVNAVRFSPDGKIFATGGGELSRSGDVHLFDSATGKLLHAWKDHHTDAVLSLDFSPDGRLLASGASDKIARVAEVATKKQTHLFEGHTHYVMGVAFRADGRVLASAGADGVVMAWDMITGERKRKIEGWTKEVTSLQFIGASNQILTSAGDNLVRIVSDEGGQIRSIANLPDFMQAAASTPSGTTLIGGGEDSILRVWDGTNGKEIAVFGMK